MYTLLHRSVIEVGVYRESSAPTTRWRPGSDKHRRGFFRVSKTSGQCCQDWTGGVAGVGFSHSIRRRSPQDDISATSRETT